MKELLTYHRKKLILTIAGLSGIVIILGLINYHYIGSYQKYIYDAQSIPSETKTVGIVFGGGVFDGQPSPLVRDRLNAASNLLLQGKVRKLIVSGDNRFDHYNEPEVMKKYLIDQHGISTDLVQLDQAGRSTYETCERAKKIFNLERAILISESTHLPRAIYTCRSFGIEAYGYKSDGQSSAGRKVGQRFRETLTRTKATFNIYIMGEPTVLGPPINL